MAALVTILPRVNAASVTSEIPANIATNIPSNIASYASYASLLPSGSVNQISGVQSDIASAQSDINSVQTTFSSWDGCMSKAYCKWPVIVAIIIASLIVLSLVICIVRCAFCGAECCCACCSCFTPSRRSRKRYSDPAPRMPYGGYQPQPGPIYAPQQQEPTGYKSGPQFATFDASSKRNADSLPTMPTWDTATSRKVLDESQDVELGELTPVDEQKAPMLAGGVPNPRVRFAGTPNGSIPGTPTGAFPPPVEQDLGDGYGRANPAAANGYPGAINPARNASGGYPPQQGFRQASGQGGPGYNTNGAPNTAYMGSGGMPSPHPLSPNGMNPQSQQYAGNTPYGAQSPYSDARSPSGQIPQGNGYFAQSGHERENSTQSQGYSRMQSPQTTYTGYNPPRQVGYDTQTAHQPQSQRPQQTNYASQNYPQQQPQQQSYSQPQSQSQQQGGYAYSGPRHNTSTSSPSVSSPPSYHTAPPSVYRRPAPQQTYSSSNMNASVNANPGQAQYQARRPEYQSYAPQQQGYRSTANQAQGQSQEQGQYQGYGGGYAQ